MNLNLSIITLITAVLLMGLVGAAGAASVTVAASNSLVKSSAQYICDGFNDQSEIQAAIDMVTPSGGDVNLLDGTFILNGDVTLARGVNLIGAGAGTTTLNSVGKGCVDIRGGNTVRDLQATGATGFFVIGSHVRMASVTVRNCTSSAAIWVYPTNEALTDIVFTNCNVIDGSSYGFLNIGEGSPRSISDITYSGCSAINCGRTSQVNPWVTGFDFAENIDSINNLLVENCRAEGCWESGFHFEPTPQKNNVTLRNCVSIDNGQKKTVEDPTFGAGFIGGSPTMQYINCTSINNLYGFSLNGNGTTVTGCKDIGSTEAYLIEKYNNIVLTDCESDGAQEWALVRINSNDVTATNFVVTNPVGNSYPAIYTSNSVSPSNNLNIQLVGSTTSNQTPVAQMTSNQTPVTQTPVTQTTITQTPVAQFKASLTSVNAKASQTIQFTDLSTGSPTSYLWKFGDGATSTEQNPEYTYKKRGIYTVTEIVKNSAGSNAIVKTKYITVR